MPAALLLLLASVLVHVQFVPGRIDHHGLQIVLVLVGLLGVLQLPLRRWAWIGGLAIGVSLSIGLEQALVVAGLMVGVAIVVATRSLDRAAGDRLAGGLVVGALLGSLLFAPPDRLFTIACDVLSLQHLVVVVLAAAGLVIATRTTAPAVTLLGMWALAGVAGLGMAPRCIDPYADVAPLLAELWLPNVSEARSIAVVLGSRPGFALAVLVPAAVAISWSLRQWVRLGMWSAWARITPALVLGFGAAFLQLRGASAATAVGVAALGAALARVRSLLSERSMLLRAGVVSLVALVISGLGPLVVGSAFADGGGDGAEGSSSIVACAEGLEAVALSGVVLAPVDLGPYLLQRPGFRVLAGPYHRNDAGNVRAWELLGGRPGAEELHAVGVTWVATCEGMPERSVLESRFGPGLLADLEDRDVPAFLEEVVTDAEGLRLYRVTD